MARATPLALLALFAASLSCALAARRNKIDGTTIQRPMPVPMPWPHPPRVKHPLLPFSGHKPQSPTTNQQFWEYLLAGDSLRQEYPEAANWKEADPWLANALSTMQHLYEFKVSLEKDKTALLEQIAAMEKKAKLSPSHSSALAGTAQLSIHDAAMKQAARIRQLETKMASCQYFLTRLTADQTQLVEVKEAFRKRISDHSVVQKDRSVFEQALIDVAHLVDGSLPAVQNVISGKLGEKFPEPFLQALNETKAELFYEAQNFIPLLDAFRSRISNLEADMVESVTSLEASEASMSSTVKNAMQYILAARVERLEKTAERVFD